ncbi:hypothetical protein Pst134EA_011842 [Puccinia striiformis f. sp. tritici]|uniref:hypothetical protein n=1 Tax=Puccinia striiformis f. sp. tritici TaxID=168172 RepID=UPI002007E825|nr:hypothetical protein Pst134EA_011842 [Puccinia striiformis f. sp. tritici]KAH9468213.1 hypothetical protein Pst134EA_011842 [Puccinia striiformis f. sp. tritici]
MWWVYGAPPNENQRQSILRAANEMGCVLQLINIARDVKEKTPGSAEIYVPKVWFEGQVDGLHLSDWEKLKNQTNLDAFPYQLVAEKLLEIAHQYQLRNKIRSRFLPPSTSSSSSSDASYTPDHKLSSEKHLHSTDSSGGRKKHEIGIRHTVRWNGDRVFLYSVSATTWSL